MKYKNILVTGGAGFIGSFLVDKLVTQGFNVKILDNLEEQVHQNKKPEYLNKDAEFIKGDVRNYSVFNKTLKNIDIVYHLASSVGVGQSNYQVKKYTDVNILGTANLLDYLVNKKNKIQKVILPSSMTGLGEGNYLCSNCGVVRPPLREEKQLKRKEWELFCPLCNRLIKPISTDEEAKEYPNSIYAITKKAQQDMLLTISNIYNIPAVVLRFFNVYGPRQSLSNPYTGVTAIFISRMKNNQPAKVYEDGFQTRDFVSVHDVVEALNLAIRSDKANNHFINIGSGNPIPIKEIAQTLANLLGKSNAVEVSEEFRKNDIRHCFADITLAKQLLDWTPKVTLKKGFEELINWSKNQESNDTFNKAQQELRQKGLA